MSEAYDIAAIYAEMEKEIISSMQRNLSGHIEEEKRVGFDYPQWQAEKLRSLRRYQIENAKIIHSYTDGLPLKVKTILQDELKQGTLNELKKYKEVMAAGYESSVVMKDSFFKINTRKVNSLIKSVDNDLAKANQACLRYVNDAYRQVIFKSEMFVANGVYTEKKAVDKAIEEFEKRGLHCIEYANGSYHDVADYADMAVKTASQRAQLMGEGEFRKKIGNSLIKISKHGGTCPLCAKWEGRVLIDDIYSGGTPADGSYPLLSEAMAAGLYHPRCRHGAGTYYPEVDDIWNDDKAIANPNENGIINEVSATFKNMDDALNYMKQFADNIDFKGVKNLESVNAINKTLTELNEKFPIDKLNSIKIDGRMSELGSSNHHQLAFSKKFLNNPKTNNDDFKEHCLKEITEYQNTIDDYTEKLKNETDFRRKQWYRKEIKDYNYWIKKTEEFSKYSRWGVDETVAGIARHEYGHIVAGQYSGLISASVPQEIIEKHHTWYNANSLRRAWQITFQKAKDTGDIYNISAYSSKNYKEFFAECFSMYSKGEKLPDYIVKDLERILNVNKT